MNAIEFLTKEHEEFKNFFEDIKDAHPERTKKKIFQELSELIIRHETIEQKIWYPRIQMMGKVSMIIKKLISQEKESEKVIKKMMVINNFEQWQEKFLMFTKEVEHHATEEEKKLFPKIAELMSEKDLKKIGTDMIEFSRKYKS